MNFHNIFVSKGNNSGWTLNFDNPLSWLILAALLIITLFAARNKIKDAVLYLKTRFGGKT